MPVRWFYHRNRIGNFKLIALLIIFIMRKLRSFEENTVENLQIQMEFQRILQIQGLDFGKQQRKPPFSSLKMMFNPHTSTNVIGSGPNANIRAFYYLLLCHIRKVHFKQLVDQRKMREAQQIIREEECDKIERRVSFNGKGAVFLNGPQYQNYALHKFRIYAFSRETDLELINNSPLESDPMLQNKGRKLSSAQMKKLLSQFMKRILPQQLPPNYKNKISSVASHLNNSKISGVLLSILMRNILLNNYEISSAKNYQQQLNDHTVCTTLCDAFAIDGLICRDNLYEINTWCKVYSLATRSDKVLFVEIFNDQFQEIGIGNDRNLCEGSQEELSESEGDQLRTCKGQNILSSYQPAEISKEQLQSPSMKQSQKSSSVMDNSIDSQIQSSSSQSKNSGILDSLEAIKTPQFQFNSDNSPLREAFNPASKPYIPDSIELKRTVSNLVKKDSAEVSLQDSDAFKRKDQIDLSKSKNSSKKQENKLIQTSKSTSIRKDLNIDSDCTPSDFFQKLSLKKQRQKPPKLQQSPSNIINNNISNNIYLSLNDSKKPSVINISTGQKKSGWVNINLN